MDLSELVKRQNERLTQQRTYDQTDSLHQDKKATTLFAASKIIQAIDIATTRIEKNQPVVTIANKDLAKTADLEALKAALERLDSTLHQESPKEALESLRMALDAIYSKPYPEQQREDFTPVLESLAKVEEAVKSLDKPVDNSASELLKQIAEQIEKIDVKPVVQVTPPKVEVKGQETDLSPLLEKLEELKGAILSPVATEVADYAPIEQGLDSVREAVERLIAKPTPLPNYSPPFENAQGDPTRIQLTDGKLPIDSGIGVMVQEDYDYIGASYPDTTTDVFTYKTGGASGTTVAVITITYIDSSKESVSSISKS